MSVVVVPEGERLRLRDLRLTREETSRGVWRVMRHRPIISQRLKSSKRGQNGLYYTIIHEKNLCPKVEKFLGQKLGQFWDNFGTILTTHRCDAIIYKFWPKNPGTKIAFLGHSWDNPASPLFLICYPHQFCPKTLSQLFSVFGTIYPIFSLTIIVVLLP